MKTIITLVTALIISVPVFAGKNLLTPATPQQVNTYNILENSITLDSEYDFKCDNIHHINYPASKEGSDNSVGQLIELLNSRGFVTFLDDNVTHDLVGGSGLYYAVFADEIPDRLALIIGYTSKDNKKVTFLYGECSYVRK